MQINGEQAPVANRTFMQGFFDWTGFDYRGENHWPETNSQYGMLDLAGCVIRAFY